MKTRTLWNKRKGKIVQYVGNALTFQNRLGKVIGCLRGDQDKDNPYVAVWYFTDVDMKPITGFYWDTPASSLKLFYGYHVTTKDKLKSIKKKGEITPSIPDDCDDIEGVYLFTSKVHVENAVMNWLGDRFEDDDELVLLTIDLENVDIQYSSNVDWEIYSKQPIPYNAIIKIERNI
jgi:hypothetical protein